MICRLCLEHTDDALDIKSDEGIQWNVSAILSRYFHFCFAVSGDGRYCSITSRYINVLHSIPKDGSCQGVVCRKCWWEVKIFHEYYIRIESLHRVTQTNDGIFEESVNEHLKIDLLAKEEGAEYHLGGHVDCHTAENSRNQFGRCDSEKSSMAPV